MLVQTSKAIKNQKGLTLIELLAVVVILAIIAVIAVPLIGNIISDTREKAVVTEALNVISAAKIAHAAGEGTTAANGNVTLTKAQLDPFISVSKITYTSVTWTGSTYQFAGLEATTGNSFPSGLSNVATATEETLAGYLD